MKYGLKLRFADSQSKRLDNIKIEFKKKKAQNLNLKSRGLEDHWSLRLGFK